MNQEPLATREQIALSFFNAETAMKFADKYHTADDKRQELEQQLHEMRGWIMTAAPMLSVASCIIIDESPGRLGEIAGCRAVLELCPVDFTSETNTP